MLTRRRFIEGTAVTAAAVAVGTPRFAHAGYGTTLDVYTASDANISDWLTNTLKPAFEKANPDYTINVVISRGTGQLGRWGNGLGATRGGRARPFMVAPGSSGP